MHLVNAHLATTRLAPEPKLQSANTKTEQITVMAFVISAIIRTIIGIKEVAESHIMKNSESDG
jgi:hypothetical protein